MVKIAKLLQLAGLVASAGEGTRKLAENAVSLNGAKTTAQAESMDVLGDSPVIRVGKKEIRVAWEAARSLS